MTIPAAPLFGLSSFEEAVDFFKSMGFQVDPGPGPEEVTLILEEPDHRTYCVYPTSLLAPMAAVAWRARFMNRKKRTRSGRPRYAGRMRASLSAGNRSWEA